MFKCLLARIFPSDPHVNARNNVFPTTLNKRFSVKCKTTNYFVGDTSPSKHDPWGVGSTAYKNLAIGPFPIEERILLDEQAGLVTEEDPAAHDDWLFMATNQNKTVLPTLNFDQPMLVEWFKNREPYNPPKLLFLSYCQVVTPLHTSDIRLP